jgi:hypothetical protein
MMSVYSSKIARIAFDASRYFINCGGTTVRCGQSRIAWAVGIAERTPNLRAS